MAVTNAVEGAVAEVFESFIDEFDDPLELANTESGPLVRLFDTDRDIIAEEFATPDPNGDIGDWVANIPVPNLDLVERVEYTVVWIFKTEENDIHRSKQAFFIDPADENRESDIIVIAGRDRQMQVALPFSYKAPIAKVEADVANGISATPAVAGDEVRFSLFRNNVALYGEDGLLASDPLSNVQMDTSLTKTTATLPAVIGQPKVEPLMLLVEYKKPDMVLPKTLTYKVWPITPQVLIAASSLEDFINKARMENVIPELDYTQADLIQYLHRGLALFNSYLPIITNFNGVNMQGPIMDAWLVCASYYALASQLQAEGAMAFDFAGQSVSLNIDRTPAIESALGRVESALESQVKPLKLMLSKNGVLDGDGSAGGRFINGSHHLGTLGMINAPTTRLPGARGGRGSTFFNNNF